MHFLMTTSWNDSDLFMLPFDHIYTASITREGSGVQEAEARGGTSRTAGTGMERTGRTGGETETSDCDGV